MSLSKIEDKDDFGKDLGILLENFEIDMMKAQIISKLEKKHLENSFGSSLKETLENIQKSHGVENIAKSHSIVVMVTSFEVFSKNLFGIIFQHDPNKLKTALRACEKLKISSKDMVKILNNKISWIELISIEESLSFQRISSFEKGFRMIGLEFEDFLEEAKENALVFLSKIGITLNGSGYDLFGRLLDWRHQIVHESKDFEISPSDLNAYLVFLQYIVLIICDKFRKVELIKIMCDMPKEE